ncbi:MAG: MFS transporter [Candidatus Heimdallarchaeota archaeon]|nr:MAG: MFS transporter [Candidatus Heimdallarchaeota archaeon]
MSSVRLQLLSFMSFAHFIHHVELYAFPAMIILISQEITMNYLEIGILGSLPILIMAITSPMIGYISKNARLGFIIVLLGIFLFAFSSFMIAISESYIHLLFGNILLGLGCTTFHPVGLGVAANSFTGENRGKAMAVNHAAGVTGTALAPLGTLGLAIYILSDWRQTFILFGLICLVLLVLMASWVFIQKLIPRYTSLIQNNNLEVQEDTIDNTSKLEYKNWIFITLGVIITISALRGGVYRLISYFTVTLLRDFYGVESFTAGILTSFILLLGSGSDIYGAYISDKSGAYGRVRIILVSAVGTSFAIISLIFLTESFPEIWAVLFGFSLFAICFYLGGGTLQALMSDIVPQESRTFFYSIVFSLGLVVSSTSPTIFGALLDIFQSPVAGFTFMLLLIMVSFFVTLLFQKRLSFAVEKNLISP